MNRLPLKHVLLLTALVTTSSWLFADSISNALFSSINERLGYMDEVALYKANHHLPVEDIDREEIVIENAKVSAREYGLNPEFVEEFFKAQIAAAKAIQYRYRADLLSSQTGQAPMDLKQQVRPQLLRLGQQILEQIALYLESHGSFEDVQFTEFEAAVDVEYVSVDDKRMLFESLQDIKLLPSK